MPHGWQLNGLLKEFECLPVAGALMDQPAGVIAEIRRLRAFAVAKELMEKATKEAEYPPWARELIDPVFMRIQIEKYGPLTEPEPETPPMDALEA